MRTTVRPKCLGLGTPPSAVAAQTRGCVGALRRPGPAGGVSPTQHLVETLGPVADGTAHPLPNHGQVRSPPSRPGCSLHPAPTPQVNLSPACG